MDTNTKQTIRKSVFEDTCIGYGAKLMLVKNQKQIDTDLEKRVKATCAGEMLVNEKLEDSISCKSLLEACGECMCHQFYSSFERFQTLKGL